MSKDTDDRLYVSLHINGCVPGRGSSKGLINNVQKPNEACHNRLRFRFYIITTTA